MATQFSVKDHQRWKARFFTIWGGQAVSIVGSQLVQFALIWYLTIDTGSATVLATASMAGTLPQVLLGPFVGTLVDRWNRRRIMLLADSTVASFTILLAVLFALNDVAVWQIYLVIFVRSLAGSFHGNAMSASTSLMVPVEHLTRIQGLNQMLNGGLNVVSAPLGALLLGILPLQGVLLIDGGTALLAILPLCFIKVPQPERLAMAKGLEGAQATIWQDFRAGFRYFLGWPGLLLVGLMTIGINFTVIPAYSLLPLMVKEYFGGNVIQLSWVESAMGIGIIAGGAILGIWGGFERKMLTSMLGLMGMGIGTLMMAIAPPSALLMAVAAALCVGIMTPITMGPFYAVIQSAVEPEMQARIITLLSSVGGGMAPIGLMIAGPVADHTGIKTWFFLGGILCVLMSLAGLITPTVMNIESHPSRPLAKGHVAARTV
jgi:DHA3 family macrolide efflux protein-like MFS transporter